MSTDPRFTDATRSLRVGARFVVVNDRIPGADAHCTLCGRKIKERYVREPKTRLLYCDTQCFTGHATMEILAFENRARQVT